MARSLFRRIARGCSLYALLPLGVVLLGLTSCQGRLIYPGQRYADVMWQRLPPDLVPLRYTTSQGSQVSFYRPPRSGGAATRIWLVCNGNGGYALQWPDLLTLARDPDAGYLLFEYPGYGFSEGSCTPGRILESSEAAVAALRTHLGLSQAAFDARLSVLAHSLGCATGLQFAARHPVQAIILAAPFTSMVDMGHHMLFWPCGQLVWHRFDNVARLAEISRQTPLPSVSILHGGDDSLIPPRMSEELAAPYRGWVRRNRIDGVDHDGIALDAARLMP